MNIYDKIEEELKAEMKAFLGASQDVYSQIGYLRGTLINERVEKRRKDRSLLNAQRQANEN